MAWGRAVAQLPAARPHPCPPRFEINFLSEAGDIAFHLKPRFTSETLVGNAFQGGCWGPEEVSSVFPLALGEPFEVMGAGGLRGAGRPGWGTWGSTGATCMDAVSSWDSLNPWVPDPPLSLPGAQAGCL